MFQGDLVYANYGELQDFKELQNRNVDCNNTIVIIRYGKIFRGEKVCILGGGEHFLTKRGAGDKIDATAKILAFTGLFVYEKHTPLWNYLFRKNITLDATEPSFLRTHFFMDIFSMGNHCRTTCL